MSYPIDHLRRFEEHDRVRLELVRERDAAPEALAVQQRAVAEAEAAEKAVKDRIDTAQLAKTQAEKDVQAEIDRIDEREKKLQNVQTNTEYQAGMREIAAQRSKISSFEDIVLERMVELDALDDELGAAKAAVAEQRKQLEVAEAETKKKVAELDGKIAEAEAAIRAVEPDLDADLLALYRKVSTLIEGSPLAEAKGSVCTGCHVGLQPQMYNELHDPNVVHTCPTCLRILFVAQAADAPADEPAG